MIINEYNEARLQYDPLLRVVKLGQRSSEVIDAFKVDIIV